MKKLIALLAILSIGIGAYTQPKVYSLRTNKSRMDKIESKYKAAIGVDSLNAVFYKQEDIEAFAMEWGSFLQDMGAYLKENGLLINERVFIRVFFDKDGRVDYFFYNIANNESPLLDRKEKKRFEKAIKGFAKTARIKASSKEGFKQCGTANLQLGITN